MFQLPCLTELLTANNVLVAGCGGGYDFMAGIPLMISLQQLGKNVTMANLSFSDVEALSGDKKNTRRLIPGACYEVNASSALASNELSYYFPEKYCCEYFEKNGQKGISIFAFPSSIGVKTLSKAYALICKEKKIDTIVLVDGGTDSLMKGDEVGLGTPTEDSTSIAAVFALDEKEEGIPKMKRRYLWCLGFGIDNFHGVNHVHFLENTAELTLNAPLAANDKSKNTTTATTTSREQEEQKIGYLGCFSLMNTSPEFKAYKDSSDYVFSKMSHHISIVNSSIINAVEGRFGNYHATARTKGSKLFINPLMSVYWCYRLEAVAKSILYMNEILKTDSSMELRRAINTLREKLTKEKKIRDKDLVFPH